MSEISIWMTQLKGLEELAQKDPSLSWLPHSHVWHLGCDDWRTGHTRTKNWTKAVINKLTRSEERDYQRTYDPVLKHYAWVGTSGRGKMWGKGVGGRRGSKGEWWWGWLHLWYIVRTFVNVTMYPWPNNNLKKFKKKGLD
jgi:hypothetical protein